ncbi:MAG: XdhC/CoxI family protein, partial [bacterium]|nr:XdhC/CoxI family protein [bacterium]
EIYEELLRLQKEGSPSAVATIVQSRGSAPQKEGAKLLVRKDGSTLGTLGGGCLEHDVIQASLMAIKDGQPTTIPFELTEKHGGLVCGGKVLVYIEPNHPEPHLVILGAGHVGKAVSKLARFSGFRVTVVDNREEYANPEQVPTASDTVVHDFDSVFFRITADDKTYILIATRGHNHDVEALQSALRTRAQYIGLLGSRRKKALLSQTLEEQGFSKEDLARVMIPVGLPIHAVTPEEIAISIMGQIIQQRRDHGRPRHSDPACSRLIDENG